MLWYGEVQGNGSEVGRLGSGEWLRCGAGRSYGGLEDTTVPRCAVIPAAFAVGSAGARGKHQGSRTGAVRGDTSAAFAVIPGAIGHMYSVQA